MAKINLNGEYLEFDFSHKPMSEALALEKATGQRYADWETELEAGSMQAMCALVWLVWRRNGRTVALGDILSGAVEVDLGALLDSLKVVADEAEAAGPTASGTAPEPTPTTPPNTSQRSPRSSASGRGR